VVEKNGQNVSSPEGRFCQTTRHIEKLPEGVYLATSDDVEGLIAQGCTWLKLLRLHEMCCDGYLRQRAKDDDILPEVADAFDYPLVTGFKYREIVKRLKRSGFEFDRQEAMNCVSGFASIISAKAHGKIYQIWRVEWSMNQWY
jgi:predicted RNase H-like HicB family nuclease